MKARTWHARIQVATPLLPAADGTPRWLVVLLTHDDRAIVGEITQTSLPPAGSVVRASWSVTRDNGTQFTSIEGAP